MDSKKIRKSLSRFSGWLGFSFCSLIMKVMPQQLLYGFAKAIASLGYAIASKQRKIAVESLNVAFGRQKPAKQIKQLARESFIYMAKSALELLFLMDRPEILRSRIALVGRNHLDEALSRKKGVILVSAHFGNFPLLLAYLALSGYKTAGIMRPMRDVRVEKVFQEKRSRMGIKTIYSQPRTACVNSTIEALRNNEIVFIPLDQNFGSGGVFVDFFGRKAATATGPVILAQRTGAGLIPCFIIRQKDDTHKIVFEPPLNLESGKGPRGAVMINIQGLTSIIESYIRKFPAEWGWIHRRWKSQPSK